LEENFDRFNFEIHKEKEMVSFRRCILALAILALFTGLASAQVIGPGGPGGSGTGQLTCAVLNTGNPTQVRSEGYAELLGDIVIQCTGGNAQAPGSAVQLANITVALSNTTVTSRVFSNGLSEALLLIDEPGAGQQVGAGGTLPQLVCTGGSAGAGPNGCTTVAGSVQTAGFTYIGAVLASNTSAVPNVFQGVVQNQNQVVFNGIPILAPVTAGFARVFRITNIRANGSALANFGTQGTTPVLASVAISSGVQLQNPVPTVGFLYNGLGATAVRNAGNSGGGTSINLLQCGTAGLTSGAVLRFTEGFAAAFKTRVATNTTAATPYSGALTSGSGPVSSASIIQNVPAQILPGSESGFVLGSTMGGTAGLADFGSRLKATFNNIPTGVNIFVSTTNLNSSGGVNTSASTNTSVAPFNTIPNVAPGITNQMIAALVLSETAPNGPGGFLPLVSNTNNSGGTLLFGPLPVDANGTATAVWEVLASNPNAGESAEFAVFYSFTGNPAQNIPPTTPAGTVSMSFAPTFSSVTASSLIPRFTPAQTSSTIVTVALCQTTLLYPFVTNANGLDTGIAVANTTSDPFGTRNQNGTCTLNFFGTAQGTTNTATTPTIAAGTVYADSVQNLRPGFNGYVIAVCNFQLAHGYALVSDIGIRNWATNYLALVLPTGTGNRNGVTVTYNPNPAGIENLGN
jgi:hypothetical protein